MRNASEVKNLMLFDDTKKKHLSSLVSLAWVGWLEQEDSNGDQNQRR